MIKCFFSSSIMKGTSKNRRSLARKSLLAHINPLHYWLSHRERTSHGKGYPIFRGALKPVNPILILLALAGPLLFIFVFWIVFGLLDDNVWFIFLLIELIELSITIYYFCRSERKNLM